jgi:hypothetical protein
MFGSPSATQLSFVPPTPPAVDGQISWGQQVRAYADPGTDITVGGTTSPTGLVNLIFHITGYLVDVPFTP